MKNAKQKGFTLIELMIVLVIIGILTTIAFTFYQIYIQRTQLNGALAEITSVKINIEEKLSHGLTTAQAEALSGSSDDILKSLGMQGSSTTRCTNFAVSIESTGASSVVCTLNGNALIAGKKIQWVRAVDSNIGVAGTWICSTSVSINIAPKVCAAGVTIA